jgi:hypothetical protein
MCGCGLKPNFASTPARSIIRAKPAVVKILDDQFGYDPNSEYKCWVRHLYGLGLISRIPSDWESPETPEVK